MIRLATMSAKKRFLGLAELVPIVERPYRTLWRLAHEQRIPASTIAGRIVVDRRDIPRIRKVLAAMKNGRPKKEEA